jgi:hypothetical protein
MTRTCSQCGFDYTSNSDFEPGTARCWQCAAKAYQKGIARYKDRARLAAQTLIEEVGSVGPENVDMTAERVVDIIQDLRGRLVERDQLLREWLSVPPIDSMHDAITIEELEERTETALKQSAANTQHSCVARYVPGDYKPTRIVLTDGTWISAMRDGVRADGVSVWLDHLRQEFRTQDKGSKT